MGRFRPAEGQNSGIATTVQVSGVAAPPAGRRKRQTRETGVGTRAKNLETRLPTYARSKETKLGKQATQRCPYQRHEPPHRVENRARPMECGLVGQGDRRVTRNARRMTSQTRGRQLDWVRNKLVWRDCRPFNVDAEQMRGGELAIGSCCQAHGGTDLQPGSPEMHLREGLATGKGR